MAPYAACHEQSDPPRRLRGAHGNPHHVVFVTDAGPRTRSGRNVRGARMFHGFSGVYVRYKDGPPTPVRDEDVTSYRHATDDEIAAASESGLLHRPSDS